jgi:murein L,D-transpeptidase YafK
VHALSGAIVKRIVMALGILTLGAGPPGPKATRVHVSKHARTLEVFAGEARLRTYTVAIGFGGAGPKTREGDGRTPVGTYHVVKHMASHLRVFMLLDYPNVSDRMRFEAAKTRGDIPSSATIGGDVGIHGEPPWAKPFRKASYSSQGCIVLTDAEIDELSRLLPDGVPVEIEE